MAEATNLQAELTELENKLAVKKQELLTAGTPQPERAVFKEVMKEHTGVANVIRQDYSAQMPAPSKPVADKPTPPSADENLKIDTLIEHSFTKGIISAVNEAKKMNDPYLLDRLHDRLSDEYYQKLLDSRQITGL